LLLLLHLTKTLIEAQHYPADDDDNYQVHRCNSPNQGMIENI
jgi:hypothetical protein